jgi:hypothetical protein
MMDPLTRTKYSIQQYVEMHYLYGKHEGNAAAAVAEFNAMHGTNTKSFTLQDVNTRLRETGCVFGRKREIGKSNVRAQEMDTVEATIEENPHISTRQIERDSGISRGGIMRALRSFNVHAFHATPVQNLEIGDFSRRRRLECWLSQNENKIDRILFSDESQFTREAIINSRNYHQWAEFNPYMTNVRNFQKQIRVNVWAGIIGNELFGPYFIPSRLNSQYYKDFLEDNFYRFYENVPLNFRNDIYFQQDGCPAHSAQIVTEFLNTKFPNRWLGLRGPIEWAPRSPDLTPLDFFLWGCLKQLIYDGRDPVQSVGELQERIQAGFDVLRAREHEGIIFNATHNVITRAHLCLNENGGHFEHLL